MDKICQINIKAKLSILTSSTMVMTYLLVAFTLVQFHWIIKAFILLGGSFILKEFSLYSYG